MSDQQPKSDEISRVQSWPQFWAYMARNAALLAIVAALLYGADKHLSARNKSLDDHIGTLMDRCVPDITTTFPGETP